MGSWLYSKAAPASASTQSLDAVTESQDLEHALKAAAYIMDDDVDSAERDLEKGDSSYHKLGKGIVTFVRATLGLEQDIMRQAASRLVDAETSAYNDQTKAQHNANAVNAYHSHIYAPGTEYLLCQCMAQLMAALVGVLSESFSESIKAFYKLRKAYIALDSIAQMEENYLKEHNLRRGADSRHGSADSSPVPGKASKSTAHTVDASLRGAKLDGKVSLPKSMSTTTLEDISNGSLESPQRRLSRLTLGSENDVSKGAERPQAKLDTDEDPDLFSHPVDHFIHSGTSLCFGLLLLFISMVPPALNKILYIIGFRGDRSRGLRLLWQASRSPTLTGAIAALTLLAFYNSFVRAADILPDPVDGNVEDIEGYPMHRLENLLADMRGRFPHSQLWVLEESRMRGANREVEEAMRLIRSGKKSPLKQVQALHVFERSIDAMHLHQYDLCTESFIECSELNSWSRALYFYIAGAAQVELYRRHLKESPEKAQVHAKKAEDLFQKAPSQAGKKKFLARQLPFDVFVTRKIAKWEARAKERNVPFIDAIGVSPIEEMNFFWNGHSRMPDDQLEVALQNLAWSENNETWSSEPLDEHAVLALLRASLLRAQRKHSEAKNILKSEILCHDRSLFKGSNKDDWTCPSAHYEMAANLWMERHCYRSFGRATALPASKKDDQVKNEATRAAEDEQKVQECKEWLEKVYKWESYELDARIGLKVTTAQETITKWEEAHAK
ncbi:Mitochondrial outer membrane protein iml2 [Microsporum ferrugineum]